MKKILFAAMALFAFSAVQAQKSAVNGKGVGGYIELGHVFDCDVASGILSSFHRIELTSSCGYHIRPYLYAGAGVGASYFYHNDEVYLPVYGNVRGTLPLRKNMSLFVDGKVGYGFDLTSSEFSGIYWTPSIGFGIDRYYISVGYVAQYQSNCCLNGVSLRFGIRL